MKKFFRKQKVFKMVITRIKSSKNFLDDGFVKTFFNTTYDDHNMQGLPNKSIIVTLLQILSFFIQNYLVIINAN